MRKAKQDCAAEYVYFFVEFFQNKSWILDLVERNEESEFEEEDKSLKKKG